MKLPQINYNTPVAPLAKENVGAAVALGNQVAQVVTKTAEMGAQIYVRVQTQKGLDAFADTAVEMNALDVEIRNRPASDPKALKDEFDTRMGAIARGPERDLSGISLATWQEKFSAKKQVYWFGASNLNAARRLSYQQESIKLRTQEYYQEGEFEAANELIDSSVVLSEPQKADMKETGMATFVFGVARRAEVSENPVEIQKALDLTSEAIDQGKVSLRQGHTLRNGLKSAMVLAKAEDEAAQEQARAIRLGNLQVGIDKGKVSLVELRQEFAVGTIQKTTKYVELQRQIEKARANKTSLANARKRLSIAVTQGQPIDPRDKGFIKAIDATDQEAYDRIEEQPITAREKQRYKADLDRQAVKTAMTTGILPKRVKGIIRAYAFRGSPIRVIYAANLYRTLQESAPTTVNKLSPDTVAVYLASSSSERAGVPISEAVEMARTNVQASPEKREILRKRFSGISEKFSPSGKAYEELMENDKLDLSQLGSPEMTPEQLGVYLATAFQYYQKFDGDEQLTMEATNDAFKNMYSGTEMGHPDGKVTVMAHAPEIYYKSLGSDFLKRDLALFAKKHKVEKIFLRSDRVTVAAEDNPSYLVFTLNKLNQPEVVEQFPGVPLRWEPKLQDEKDLADAIAARKRRFAPKPPTRTSRKADARQRKAEERQKKSSDFVPTF